MTILYENEWVYIEQEEADIPWLKVFAKEEAKELTDCSKETQAEIFRILLILEKEMISSFQPDKINIASFANYLPKVHWHIMARYKKDSHFPEPMWGVKQREAEVGVPKMDEFIKKVSRVLDKKV
jgi:diadenosine tetraphosphate (Ap4A) HIT family hydrolase